MQRKTRLTPPLLLALVIAIPSATAQERSDRPARPSLPPRFRERIELLEDLDYAGNNNPRQKLDLLLPRERSSADPLPVIAFIHGGAWRAGNKRSGVGRVAPLVASGAFAGASIGYRLSGEAKWPAQIHDCKAAIRWLRANAGKHGLDGERIAVWGSSAGGHLVALLGTSGGVEDLEGSIGEHDEVSSRVRCVVDYFGPTDFLRMNERPSRIDHLAANSPESLLLGGPVLENKEKARQASPLTYIDKGDPPILIVHGTDDRVVPFHQSELLLAACKKAGAPAQLVPVEGGGHGGFRSDELLRRVRRFLDRELRGIDGEVPPTPVRPNGDVGAPGAVEDAARDDDGG